VRMPLSKNTCLRRIRSTIVIEGSGSRTKGMGKEYCIIRMDLSMKATSERTGEYGGDTLRRIMFMKGSSSRIEKME